MKLLVVFGILATIALTTASVVPAATLIRAPQYDSAIIQSDRVGGNFAYSTLEGHAYKSFAPALSTHLHPLQYRYQLSPVYQNFLQPNPVQFTYPQTQQLIFGQPIFSQFAPARPIEAPTQPASPAQITAPASQGTALDDDTVAIESA